MCVHVYMSVGFVHMCTGTCRGQKRTKGSLELPQVVRYLIWVLGTKYKSYAKAVGVTNC